jgi:hypothetical protein
VPHTSADLWTVVAHQPEDETLTVHRRALKIRAGEGCGEVTIAARSQRPRDLSLVMHTVIIPALLNLLIPASHDQEPE